MKPNRSNEIDIVALNDDQDILFCECKWKKRKADELADDNGVLLFELKDLERYFR